jgi:hypothetical protein
MMMIMKLTTKTMALEDDDTFYLPCACEIFPSKRNALQSSNYVDTATVYSYNSTYPDIILSNWNLKGSSISRPIHVFLSHSCFYPYVSRVAES